MVSEPQEKNWIKAGFEKAKTLALVFKIAFDGLIYFCLDCYLFSFFRESPCKKAGHKIVTSWEEYERISKPYLIIKKLRGG